MRVPLALLGVVSVLLAVGCGSSTSPPRLHRSDPPQLVPWRGMVGDIALGEPEKRFVAEYGKAPRGGVYRLHGGKLTVYVGNGRVQQIGVSTGYYRTRWGIGVGSRIPLGACVRTLAPSGTTACGHRWHGFLWNEFTKASACGCWVKVGLGKTSQRPSVSNFLKPWLFAYVRGDRVTSFGFVLHFVD